MYAHADIYLIINADADAIAEFIKIADADADVKKICGLSTYADADADIRMNVLVRCFYSFTNLYIYFYSNNKIYGFDLP